MTPKFSETNEALYHTLTYFKIGRISEQIKKFNGEPNLSYLDSWHDITLRSHQLMENEINQNIIGSVHFIQLTLFEYLKDWLNNWQFNKGFEKEIEYLIDQQNEKEKKRFQEEIKRDKEEYEKTIPPGVPEGGEYTIKIPPFYNFLSGKMTAPKTEIRINQFIHNKKPDLINKKYLPEYVLLVEELIESFRRHSDKYVTNFFSGNYSVNTNSFIPIPLKQLSAPVIQANTIKVKVNITVKELLYLFKSLLEEGVIDKPETLKNLQEVIATNFETNRTSDMKTEKLHKWWSELGANEAAYWEDKFILLHKRSRKDNPNRLKPKR